MDAFEKLVEKHFPEQKSLQALMEMVQEQILIMLQLHHQVSKSEQLVVVLHLTQVVMQHSMVR